MQSLRIRELEIRNFRGIECSQLQFDDANILVGNNGSGKTATLAAIARLLPAMRQETRLFLDADFRMDESWTAQTITLNYKIEIDDQEIDLEISGNRKNTGVSRSHINDQAASIIDFKVSDEEKLSAWLTSAGQPTQRIVRYGWEGGRVVPINLDVQGSSTHAATSEKEEMGHFDSLRARLVELHTSSELGEIVGENYPDLEANVLATTNLLLGVERFSKVRIGYAKQVMLGTPDGGIQPFTEVSGGEKSVIHLAMALEQEARKKSQILILEEPETMLHPLIQGDLVQIVRDRIPHAQIFVTTHSPYIFQNQIEDSAVLIPSTGGSGKTFERYDPRNWLVGYPSFAEINYRAYQVYTTDFHNELYGALQDHVGSTSNSVDRFLDQKGITRKNRTWRKQTDSVVKAQTVTLSTYIRHAIHHPENVHNTKFTTAELEQSTKSLISALQVARGNP